MKEPGWLDLGQEGVGPRLCPSCAMNLHRNGYEQYDDDYIRTLVDLNCPLCGWNIDYVVHGTYVDPYRPIISYEINVATVLLQLDVNASHLGFDELGAFLRSHTNALYDLSWRRFESLVADVYRQLGFNVILTQPSKDDGADILILRNDNLSVNAIIECKRFAAERRVGVSLVRTLVGAAVMWDVRRATLVTTSEFTSGAKISANNYQTYGFEIDLVAASDLVRLLGVYNPKFTPLASITEEEKRYIVSQNKISAP
jgi:Restriction endonuclease